MRYAATALVFALSALPVSAEPIDGKSAKKALFSPKGFSVDYVEDSGLSETQLGYFKILVESRQSKKQFGRVARYYGAIAVSPSIFEMSPAELLADPESVPFQMAGARHTPGAADAAALSSCNKLVKGGAKKCVVAARILPKRWKDKGFSMFYAATANFKLYRDADEPKAFAVSATGIGFGLANGEGAAKLAIDACHDNNGEEGKRDCEVVVVD